MGFFGSSNKIRTKDVDRAVRSSGLSRKRREYAAGVLRKSAKSGKGLTPKELTREIRGLRKDTTDPLRRSDVEKIEKTLKEKLE